MREDTYLMWLSRIDGLGFKKQEALLQFFGCGEDIFLAKEAMLTQVEGLTQSNVGRIRGAQIPGILEQYEEELFVKKIQFISKYNEDYPPLLKKIYDPPLGLYVMGQLPKSTLPIISIVGSRRCSEYGLTVSYKLAKDLAKRQVVIVSGMARGIDTQAHLGALDGGGDTIAVLGCGVDICYPAENRVVKERILKKGCLISEFPPGTNPLPVYFPMRNRIISGLSTGTVVVEAAEKSGTLITVGQALEQGRDIFAVPGNVTSKLSRGTNALIQQGAVLVSDYTDVLNALGISTTATSADEKKAENALAQEEKLVYDCISLEPLSIEEIMIQTNSQLNTIQYLLTMLELKGFIQKLPGQRYIRSL